MSKTKVEKTYNYSDPLYDTNRKVVRTMDMFVEEFETNFDDAIDLLEFIIKNYQKVLATDENQNKLELMLEKSAERIEQLTAALPR